MPFEALAEEKLLLFGYYILKLVTFHNDHKLFGRRHIGSPPIFTKIIQIVTRSVNQSFGRTINTSICTLAVMAVLSIFALLANLDSLISFAIPMMFGIVSGFYSSTFITGPLWATWVLRKKK